MINNRSPHGISWIQNDTETYPWYAMGRGQTTSGCPGLACRQIPSFLWSWKRIFVGHNTLQRYFQCAAAPRCDLAEGLLHHVFSFAFNSHKIAMFHLESASPLYLAVMVPSRLCYSGKPCSATYVKREHRWIHPKVARSSFTQKTSGWSRKINT